MTTLSEPRLAQQRLERLARANVVRIANKDLKNSIRSLSYHDGLRHVAGLLEEPPPGVESVQVGALLRSIRLVKHAKTERWCGVAGIRSTSRTVGELTVRQRTALAGVLRSWADSRPYLELER